MNTVINIYNDDTDIIITLKLNILKDYCCLKKRIIHTYNMFVLLDNNDIASIGISHDNCHIQIWNCKSPKPFIESYAHDMFEKLLSTNNFYINIENKIKDMIEENNVMDLKITINLDEVLMEIFNKQKKGYNNNFLIQDITPINTITNNVFNFKKL